MKFETMTLPESISSDYLIATYYMKSDSEPDIFDWVKLVAADQSAGTWTHVEGETPEVIEKYGAKVIGIYSMAEERGCVARIAFPVANFPIYMPMIMSTVAGNVLGQDGIKLVDIEFPDALVDEFPGPLMGIDGIRELLNVPERPIVGAILKPCIGVEPEVSASGAVKAALGGAEVIKDDELLSDPEYSPMVKRVSTVMKYLRDVGKDKSALYAVNITGENLLDRARWAIDAGANSIMVNYQALGWGVVEDLVRALKRENVTIPIFGHCAGAGAYYRSAVNGISTALTVGKLPRMIGMDMSLVYPDSGRFGIETNQLVEAHSMLTSPLGNLKQSFTTIAGGVHPGTIEYLMNLLGNETILMAGGGIYGHPMGPTAGAKAILQAIEAVQAGSKVEDAAKSYPELDTALKFWG
jgi:2,3-diketo-5-methylthiopentyl-1-phosphate enolase